MGQNYDVDVHDVTLLSYIHDVTVALSTPEWFFC